MIIPESKEKVRNLPSLYLGPEIAYTHRDVEHISERVRLWADAIEQSPARPTYTFRACSYRGMKGLYGRELFERSIFRRRLARRGIEFDTRPYVYFDIGIFESEALGSFAPEFIILGGGHEDPAQTLTTEGAMLPFVLATYRLGPIRRSELSALIEATRGLRAISAAEPQTLLHALQAA